MRLRATIQGAGRNAAGILIPDEFVSALGPSRRPAVRVTIGEYSGGSDWGVRRG